MLVITIIAFIVILTVLVLFHELGHFWTARAFGVKVREFGLGLPPRLIGARRKGKGKSKSWEVIKGSGSKLPDSTETIYSLNWLPIGGFVNIGEDDGNIADPESFQSKSPGRRALILSAGVIMNALLTVVLLTIVFAVGFPRVVDPTTTDLSQVQNLRITVNAVLESSPAEAAGLEAGDDIVAVDGGALTRIEEFKAHVSDRPGQEVSLLLGRGGESVTTVVRPEEIELIGGVGIGVGLINTAIVSEALPKALLSGVVGTGQLVVAIVEALGDIIGDLVSSGRVEQDFAGPVGIAVLTGRAVNLGLVNVLQFAALLSINLAIINILPFPALDGGRILFIILEKLRGKPVAQKIENLTHTVGFALLIGLIILVTYKDITRFGSSIVNAFKGIF